MNFSGIKGFFENKKTIVQWIDPITNRQEQFAFDCTVSEGHSHTADITDYPVEDGSVYSDNMYINPKKLSLETIISDDPITLEGAMLGNAAAAFGNIPTPAGALAAGAVAGIGGALLNKDTKQRSLDHFRILTQLQENKVMITVVTGLRVYPNMMIAGMDFPRTKETGRSLKTTISLTEIKIAQTEKVKIPPKNTKKKGSVKKRSQGNKPGTAATAAQEAKGKTIAKSMFDFFKG